MFLGDESLEKMKEFVLTVESYDLINATESDTRLKIIDEVLFTVFRWPKGAVKTEYREANSIADYVLSTHRPIVVVEAKKVGISFRLPSGRARFLKVGGVLWLDKNIREAMEQAQGYCNQFGIPFAIVTNGEQWIIFKAIDPDRSWRENSAVVFYSLSDIKENFTIAWNILSYDSIRNDSLKKELKDSQEITLFSRKVIETIPNADEKFYRNSFHSQLQPLIDGIFRDISENTDLLGECYVEDRWVEDTTKGLKTKLRDSVPPIAERDNTKQIFDRNRNLFKDKMRELVKAPATDTTILLMGGVGSGKTTYIIRYFNKIDKGFIEGFCKVIYFDFRTMAPDESQIQNNCSQIIIDDFESSELENNPAVLREIFDTEIQKFKKSVWIGLTESKIAEETSVLIKQSMADKNLYAKRICDFFRKKGKSTILIFDNLDQTSFSFQQSLFLYAHSISISFQSIVIVALREETYFSSSQNGAFNAYLNLRYHISTPEFKKVFERRLDFGNKLLKKPVQEIKEFLNTNSDIEIASIRDFLSIVTDSFFISNKDLLKCVKALCGGNTREALDFCNSFMVSGYADIDKMLKIKSQEGSYRIGLHEFAKSIIYGERKFYKEAVSKIANVYEPPSGASGSHFTISRILKYLLNRSDISSIHGSGFVQASQVIKDLTNIFGNENDILEGIKKLLLKKMIETETYNVAFESHCYIRLVQSGEYFLKEFSLLFVYLDAVFIDTTIKKSSRFDELSQYALTTNLEERLKRTSIFIDYLSEEEDRELALVPAQIRKEYTFSSEMQKSYKDEVERVTKSAARKELYQLKLTDSLEENGEE